MSSMNSAVHSLHIHRSDFHLKKNIWPSNFEKILLSNKFLMVPLYKIILYGNQDGIWFLWDLRLWILAIQPFHFYTLANCRPVHPFQLNFTTSTMIMAFHKKNFFFPFNCYNLAICEVTLSEIFPTNYYHSKVQDLTVGSIKTSFHFNHRPTC
jgi:hypothetical protein